MPNYVRAFDPGGTFFFTVVTENRAPILCGDLARPLLREAFESVRKEMPFESLAFVLLPDHLHTIWTLPEGDSDYAKRWSLIKGRFARTWVDAGGTVQPRSDSREKNRRLGVWQRRFWEHLVRAEEYETLAAYIHYNPVKHGHSRCPHEWPWSSFHRWVKDGRLPSDWECVCTTPREPRGFDHRLGAFE